MLRNESDIFRYPMLPLRQRLIYLAIILAVGLMSSVFVILGLGTLITVPDEGGDWLDVFGGVVALLFGGLFYWACWISSIWAFPFQFEVDAEERKSCYRWGVWKRKSRDLSQVMALEGRVFPGHRSGPGWMLCGLGSETDPDREFDDGLFLYNTPDRYGSMDEAKAACEEQLRPLAEHLSLPYSVKVTDS